MTLTQRIALTTTLVLITSGSATAQEAPRVEVSAGYQLLHLADEVDETFGKGWYADLSAKVANSLSVVFQVGGNYKTAEESATVSGVSATFKASIKVHEFLGGVRIGPGGQATVRPFAQLLLGGVNGTVDASGTVTGGGTTFLEASESDSSTELGLQAGGGINVRMTDNVGVRVGADYLRLFSDDGGNLFRLSVGAVFGF